MELFLVGVIGFVVCLIVLFFRIRRQQSKRVLEIFAVSFLFLGAIGMVYAVNAPETAAVQADYDDIMEGNMNGKIVCLTGDIAAIKKEGKLYHVTVKAQDGTYKVVMTEEVPGPVPQVGDKQVSIYVTPECKEDQLVLTVVRFDE
jgi:uncharacterized YccA/Bax inhibitor family protein